MKTSSIFGFAVINPLLPLACKRKRKYSEGNPSKVVKLCMYRHHKLERRQISTRFVTAS